MRQVVISAIVFDPEGWIPLELSADAQDRDITRRVARVATLDGGAAVNDFGFSDADRTMVLAWETLDAERESAISRMVQVYSRLHVSAQDGFFVAVPDSYRVSASGSRLSLLVLEKVSA